MHLRPLLALLLSLIAVPALALDHPDRGVLVDRVIAVVNDEVITEGELSARLPAVRKQLERQRVRVPADEVLRRGVLERMVIERLQLQAAARLGIEVKEERVSDAIRQIAQENDMTLDRFQATLKAEGVELAELREQVRAQLVIQQLVEREISNRITVSNSELESFQQREGQGQDVEYNLSHILIAVPETATPQAIQEAKQRAESLRRELDQGASFEQLAIAHSQDTRALEAGSLGWKKAGQLPALFVSALADLELGEVSDVLRSPNGFHILKLNEKRGGNAPFAVTQTRARHILIRPNELVTPEAAERRIAQLRERIEHGEDFAALAKAHSDDTASASSGGELGWVNPGQMVPEFEKALGGLDVNELSGPVRSRFGVHLIQVLERRQQDLSEERALASARQQIHARKADERYEQWLRQLRDEAYVEYKVN